MRNNILDFLTSQKDLKDNVSEVEKETQMTGVPKQLVIALSDRLSKANTEELYRMTETRLAQLIKSSHSNKNIANTASSDEEIFISQLSLQAIVLLKEATKARLLEIHLSDERIFGEVALAATDSSSIIHLPVFVKSLCLGAQEYLRTHISTPTTQPDQTANPTGCGQNIYAKDDKSDQPSCIINNLTTTEMYRIRFHLILAKDPQAIALRSKLSGATQNTITQILPPKQTTTPSTDSYSARAYQFFRGLTGPSGTHEEKTGILDPAENNTEIINRNYGSF